MKKVRPSVLNIQYLILAITSRCNLCCRYCYQKAARDGEDMTDEVLDNALSLIAGHNAPCHVQITGGEPTLVPATIARIVDQCRSMACMPTLAIQTNGTLLTPELVQLLRKYAVQVGISIDGPPDIQEDIRGKAVETLRGLKLLEEYRIPFRVTTVVTERNILHLDKLVLLLAGFTNSRGIGLDLLVDKGRATSEKVRPTSHQDLQKGMRQLVTTLAMVNSRRRIPIRLREFDLLNRRSTRHHFCQAATGQSLAVHPDGTLFPCGQTMADPAFSMGTVMEPDIPENLPLTAIRLTSHRCRTCPLDGRCPGDCPSRTHYNLDKSAPLVCTMYKALVE